MLNVLCFNLSSRALEDSWRLIVCMRHVGGSISLDARIAPAAEEPHGRVARRPLRHALQRDSDGGK